MTGTALENDVDEMISLISILQPDLANQIKGFAFMSSAPQFRLKIAPVYYRRKRDDVLTELPELIQSEEWCEMNSEEEELYENAVCKRIRRSAKSFVERQRLEKFVKSQPLARNRRRRGKRQQKSNSVLLLFGHYSQDIYATRRQMFESYQRLRSPAKTSRDIGRI